MYNTVTIHVYACETLCTTENGTWMEDVCKLMGEGQGLKMF
jgi:hypothetical protein